MAGPVTSARAALAQWLEHLAKERRASPRTVEAYAFAGGRYLAFLEQHRGGALSLTDMGSLAPAEIRAWLAQLRQGLPLGEPGRVLCRRSHNTWAAPREDKPVGFT